MVNTLKVKAKIVELGLTQNVISDKMKLSQCTLSQKINNVRPMTLDEADELGEILELSNSEYHTYFFANYPA